MKNKIIRAISGNHALLRNGQVPIIGFTCDKLSYGAGGGCFVALEVCFILYCRERKYRDQFFFSNNNELTYMAISCKEEQDQYITSIYQECIRDRRMKPEKFIDMVVDAYVNHEMGFTNN